MITGAQIREARRLLGWERRELAMKSKVKLASLIRAESVDGEPSGITIAQAHSIQQTLVNASVEFVQDDGVRLKAKRI